MPFKEPPSRNLLNSNSNRSEVDPLLGLESELVLVPISVLVDDVDCGNDNRSDGSRSGPGFAVNLGSTLEVDITSNVEGSTSGGPSACKPELFERVVVISVDRARGRAHSGSACCAFVVLISSIVILRDR